MLNYLIKISIFSVLLVGGLMVFNSKTVNAAHICNKVSEEIVACGGCTLPDPTYSGCHFCLTCGGGATTVSKTKYYKECGKKIIYYQDENGNACSGDLQVCEAIFNLTEEVACDSGGTCGNGIKEVNECCDGGASCDGTCSCIGGGGAGSCGDNVCNNYETNDTCPEDCGEGAGSSCTTNPIGISQTPPKNVITYQGDSAYPAYRVDSYDGFQYFDVTHSGCPTGATCTGNVNGGQVYEGPSGDEPLNGTFPISTTASTPPGDYPFYININSVSEPACGFVIAYTITIKPSRKSVCDNVWHEIPPAPVPYQTLSNPLALFNNGVSNFEKYIKPTYSGQYLSNTCSSWVASTRAQYCRYLNGTSDTCIWDMPLPMENTYGGNPAPCPPAVYGWPENSGSTGVASSVVDPAGRTYEVRRVIPFAPDPGSNNRMEYKCSLPASPTANIYATNHWSDVPTGGSVTIANNYSPSTVLTWDSANATSCTVTSLPDYGTWSGLNKSSPGQVVSNITQSPTVFTLNCTGPGGTASDTVQANIPPMPLSATATCNGAGNQITFNWTLPNTPLGTPYTLAYVNMSIGADTWSCAGSPFCSSNVTGGTVTANVSPNVTYHWWIHTQDAGPGSTNTNAWSDVRQGNITCVPAAAVPVVSISANPTSGPVNVVNPNLTWSASNSPTSCTASGDWSGSKPVSGTNVSQGVLATVKTYTYTLICSNANGPSAPQSATVTVSAAAAGPYSLTVIKAGQGTVNGVSTPVQPNISCGGTCTLSYSSNTEVVLTATPASGRIFTGWTVQGGGSCPGTSTCTVTMNADKAVTANFALNPNYKEF